MGLVPPIRGRPYGKDCTEHRILHRTDDHVLVTIPESSDLNHLTPGIINNSLRILRLPDWIFGIQKSYSPTDLD